MNSKHNKHLTKDDRDTIEGMLNKHDSTLADIARVVQKSTSTISKEIKLNRTFYELQDSSYKSSYYCSKAPACYQKNLCLDMKICDKLCKFCSMKCITFCKKFTAKKCKRKEAFPWVCNGCHKRYNCRLPRYFYYAKNAQLSYQERLSTSRMGINLTPDEISSLSLIVSNALSHGQPISHIILSDILNVPRSQRSLYNYIDKGYLNNVSNLDLRRKVGYRARKVDKRTLIRTIKDNRNIENFNDFVASHETPPLIVQMDTVQGRKKDSKCLLTLYFVEAHFMLARLLPDKRNDSIINAIDEIHNIIGTQDFQKLFPVILTDNGTEFVHPERFEVVMETGEIRTRLFYCNPYSSFEKGAIEKNHEYIRYILPKRSSFDELTQDKVNTMMSHINSTKRPSTKNASPYQLACLYYGETLIKKLGIREINPRFINLTPTLIKD